MDIVTVMAVVLSLAAAVMAAIALFRPRAAPGGPGAHTHSFLELAEFKGVHADLRDMYQKHVVDGIWPVVTDQLNAEWDKLTAKQKQDVRDMLAGYAAAVRTQATQMVRKTAKKALR